MLAGKPEWIQPLLLALRFGSRELSKTIQQGVRHPRLAWANEKGY